MQHQLTWSGSLSRYNFIEKNKVSLDTPRTLNVVYLYTSPAGAKPRRSITVGVYPPGGGRLFYTYVIRSREGTLHIGSTPDMDKCLERHNAGMTYRTRKGSDWETVYVEPFTTRKEALDREQWLKTEAGGDFINRLLEQRSASGK